MEFLTLMFKGFLVGVAKIIPGVSCALIAISLGIYEKAIKAISNFLKIQLKTLCFYCRLE